MLIQVESQKYSRILLLKAVENGEMLFLIAFNAKSNAIEPIPSNVINVAMHGLRRITFPKELEKSIESIHKNEFTIANIVGEDFIKISDYMIALLSSTSTTLEEIRVELELLPDTRFAPKNFVFAAFDGVNTNIYFELPKESIEESKGWGILSHIKLFINSKYSGDYFAQKTCIINENQMSFFCQTKLNSVMSRKVMPSMRANVNVFEISDFIASSAGFFNSVSFSEVEPTECWYTIIIPIIGLQITEEFGVGCVEFCTEKNSEIKRAIEYNGDFKAFTAFALVHVNNVKMFSAFWSARKQIEQALDLLVSVLKDDSIYSIHSLSNHLANREIDCFEAKVFLSSLVYIESPLNDARLACNHALSNNNTKLLVTKQFIEHKNELEKAELLLMKANGTNDKNITPLFNSLKWVRKSWDTDDFDDKIIYSIIALEFIVSKEPNVPMLDSTIRGQCTQAIREIVCKSCVDLNDKEQFLQDITDKFNRAYTETPFMLKLQNLIARLNIPVSKDEMDLIKKARKQRNGIVHGRDNSHLPTDDVYKLCACISRIALNKINCLEV